MDRRLFYQLILTSLRPSNNPQIVVVPYVSLHQNVCSNYLCFHIIVKGLKRRKTHFHIFCNDKSNKEFAV